MKRIIVLYGHHDCGKTQTLNCLRELIRENGGESRSKQKLPCSDDISEVFLYKGQIVCVCTGGDTGEIVAENLEYANKENAGIVFTASRTRGASIDFINAEAGKHGIQVEWFPKSYEYELCEETQKLCNKEVAKILLEKLYKE